MVKWADLWPASNSSALIFLAAGDTNRAQGVPCARRNNAHVQD